MSRVQFIAPYYFGKIFVFVIYFGGVDLYFYLAPICHISFGAKETWRKENMCDEIFLNLLSQSLDRIFILLEKASVTRGINPTQTDTCNLKTVRSWSKFKKFHMHGFNYTLIFKLFS